MERKHKTKQGANKISLKDMFWLRFGKERDSFHVKVAAAGG